MHIGTAEIAGKSHPGVGFGRDICAPSTFARARTLRPSAGTKPVPTMLIIRSMDQSISSREPFLRSLLCATACAVLAHSASDRKRGRAKAKSTPSSAALRQIRETETGGTETERETATG